MSSNDKKDLTRIEDLSEFIHELEGTDGFEPQLPDLPADEPEESFEPTFGEDEAPAFEASEETPPEETPTEVSFTEEAPAEESTDFGGTDFGGSTDFGGGAEFGAESSETTFDSGDAFSASGDSFGNESTFGTEETPAEEPSFGIEESTEAAPQEDSIPEQDISFGADTETEKAPEPEPESEPEQDNDFPSLADEPAPSLMNAAPVMEKTPLQTSSVETSAYKQPENFSDVKKFAEVSSFAGMGAEGNPSFSVLIKNVRYMEDVSDITTLMKELGLVGESEDQMRGRLMRGNLLVPRISEFAAILLAHKLRRFDVDIQVGLSDEIHPPKHDEAPETGIVSKHNLYQNQTHNFHFDNQRLEISQIIVAATPSLEGYQVVRYLGVASEHKMLDSHLVEDEGSMEVPKYYQELAQKLKAHALKAHSNAVVGLNYQLTPLPSEYGMSGAKYRLTCTGNLVWVNKL